MTPAHPRRRIALRLAFALGAVAVLAPTQSSAKDPPKEALAVSVVIDTSGSMSGSRMTEAKRGLKTFLKTLNPRMEAGLIGFDDCRADDIFPIEPQVDDTLASNLSKVEGLQARSSTPIVTSYKAAHAKVSAEEAAQRGILLITDGMGTCADEKSFCDLSKQYLEQGINTVVVGYLLAGSAKKAFECGGVNVYYGIDEKTPEDEYGERLIRAMFRARREFLSHLDPKYLAGVFAEAANPFCVEEKLGTRWNLLSMSEVRLVAGRKPRWVTSTSPIDLQDFHPLQPAGFIPGIGKVEVGVEDLVKGKGAEKISYIDAYESAMKACSEAGTEAFAPSNVVGADPRDAFMKAGDKPKSGNPFEGGKEDDPFADMEKEFEGMD